MKRFYETRYTLLLSALLGYFLAASSPLTIMLSVYDRVFPVVVMEGTLVTRLDDGSAVIHLTGEKRRDCAYVKIDSYSMNQLGIIKDANQERVDGVPNDGASKPVGKYDLGTWRIFPVDPDASKVSMYSVHRCSDRTVYTKIAEVPLIPIQPT